jgi:hypothetical protein
MVHHATADRWYGYFWKPVKTWLISSGRPSDRVNAANTPEGLSALLQENRLSRTQRCTVWQDGTQTAPGRRTNPVLDREQIGTSVFFLGLEDSLKPLKAES